MIGSHHRAALVGLSLVLPFAARAQTMRGIVVDASSSPVSGVVVMLLDSASRVVARGMTTSQGEFRVTAAHAGTYRLRTLRIGFHPTISEPRLLAAGTEFSSRVELAGIPIALDTIRTTSRNVCRSFTDAGAATYAVWEQVHAALTATDLTASTRTILATTLSYQRTLETPPGSGREIIGNQRTRVATAYVTRPWRELPPDSLRRAGYVIPQRDNTVSYYAPGLSVLLSDGFIEDHCFRLTTDDKSPSLVGIAFEPSPARKKLAEIRGTMWVDRASAELRRLEFGYANVSPEEQQRAGGNVEFKRVRDGTWLISRWNVRMPVLEQDVRGSSGGFRSEVVVAAMEVSGGELALARRGYDTLWARPPLAVRGTIRDSMSGAGIAGARIALVGTRLETTSDDRGRFSLTGALPGDYTAEVETPSLDSVNTAHRAPVTILDSATAVDVRAPSGAQLLASLCGKAMRGSSGGVIVGNAGLADASSSGAILAGLRVTAEWRTDAADPTKIRRTETGATTDGSFRICGVPLNTSITLGAHSGSAATADTKLVFLSSAVRLARMNLTLLTASELAKRGAIFVGTVIADSSRVPIAGAEVSLPDIEKSTFTDSAGAFRIAGIAPGEHRVVVRRIGYGAADTKLVFTGFERIERRIVLGRAITLEAVEVTARANDREMPGFEDNKRVGLGKFMTRAEIATFDGMTMTSALSQFAALAVIAGQRGIYAMSRRSPSAMCRPGPAGTPDKLTETGACLVSHGYYIPEIGESAPVACYALVYLDGQLMNGSREPTEPFDLRLISPERIEAMEYYAGPAETPLKYARMGSNCGVLVIWRRRS